MEKTLENYTEIGKSNTNFSQSKIFVDKWNLFHLNIIHIA